MQTNSFGWIGRQTTIFGWNNTGSKRFVKIIFGHVLQIAFFRKTGDAPSFDILCCFFFTVLIGNVWLTMKRVACKRQTFLLAHRWPLSGDERVETFAVRKLYETTILINLRVDGLIRSHRLIESIFRVRVLIHIITPTFFQLPSHL